VVGNEVCVVEREGVKQDVMDVDSSSDEDEGKCEGEEMANSAPFQKQIQNKNIGAPFPSCILTHRQASPAGCARVEPAPAPPAVAGFHMDGRGC
jgi:hypothetical protein